MNKLFPILLLSCILAGKLEVEGDLKVSGNIEAGTIDSLQQVIYNQQQQISALQLLIQQLQNDISFLGIHLGVYDCTGAIGGAATIDSCGVCDGNNQSMDACGTCDGTITDIYDCVCIDYDGNEYETITIGTQNWMAENLRNTHYQNGDGITDANSSTEDWNWTDGDAYAYYDFNENIYSDEGLLYNFDVARDDREICPAGWHVPTDDDWKVLELYIGLDESIYNGIGWRGTDEGYKLKDESFNGSNSSGFTAMPSGLRNFPSLEFEHYGNMTYYWSSTLADGATYAWARVLMHDEMRINRSNHHKHHGFSIRCVQNNE